MASKAEKDAAAAKAKTEKAEAAKAAKAAKAAAKEAEGSKDRSAPAKVKAPSAKVLAELSPAPVGCEWLIIPKFGADPVLIESNHPLVLAARA